MSEVKQRFSGLRNLLASASGLTQLAGQVDGYEPEVDGNEGDGADPVDPATPPADPAPAADPADPVEGDAGPAAGTYEQGFDACNARWAAVMLDEGCQANLEFATELLADADMRHLSAEKIISLTAKAGASTADTTALQLLERTPKPSLGGGANAPKTSEDDVKALRQASLDRVNAGVRARAPGGKTKKGTANNG